MPDPLRKHSWSPWDVYDALTGLGVTFRVVPISYRDQVFETIKLDYQDGSEQHEAVRAFSAEIRDYHDELIAIVNEQECDLHDIRGCPFVPHGLTIGKTSKTGDPRAMNFKNRRGMRTHWAWRKFGIEWRWGKTTKAKTT